MVLHAIYHPIIDRPSPYASTIKDLFPGGIPQLSQILLTATYISRGRSHLLAKMLELTVRSAGLSSPLQFSEKELAQLATRVNIAVVELQPSGEMREGLAEDMQTNLLATQSVFNREELPIAPGLPEGVRWYRADLRHSMFADRAADSQELADQIVAMMLFDDATQIMERTAQDRARGRRRLGRKNPLNHSQFSFAFSAFGEDAKSLGDPLLDRALAVCHGSLQRFRENPKLLRHYYYLLHPVESVEVPSPAKVMQIVERGHQKFVADQRRMRLQTTPLSAQ